MTTARQRQQPRRPAAEMTDPTTWAADPLALASDPTTWASDPTTWAADLTRPAAGGGNRLSANGMTPVAPSAANVSAQGATGDDDTVMRRAPNEPTGNDNAAVSGPRSNAAGGVSSTSTKLNATAEPAPTQCEQCGAPFVARRPWRRFCSARCRRSAWVARNPERAAELARRDRARLRASIEARGDVWEERHDVEAVSGGEL